MGETISPLIQLEIAAGKCPHYPGDCGKIALFCSKNNSTTPPPPSVSRSFSISDHDFLLLTALSPSETDGQRLCSNCYSEKTKKENKTNLRLDFKTSSPILWQSLTVTQIKNKKNKTSPQLTSLSSSALSSVKPDSPTVTKLRLEESLPWQQWRYNRLLYSAEQCLPLKWIVRGWFTDKQAGPLPPLWRRRLQDEVDNFSFFSRAFISH